MGGGWKRKRKRKREGAGQKFKQVIKVGTVGGGEGAGHQIPSQREIRTTPPPVSEKDTMHEKRTRQHQAQERSTTSCLRRVFRKKRQQKKERRREGGHRLVEITEGGEWDLSEPVRNAPCVCLLENERQH